MTGVVQTLTFVYKDARPSVIPGQPASVTLDVSPTQNVSIEATCTNQSQYCDRVYFWEAELEYPPLPPQQRWIAPQNWRHSQTFESSLLFLGC
jgi:hypothetical protein